MATPADEFDPAAQRNQPPAAVERPPIPWHFKVVVAFAALYIFLRIVQMLGWIGVTVKEIHNAVAVAIIVVNLAAAAWCLVLWKRDRPLVRGALVLAMVGWYLF